MSTNNIRQIINRKEAQVMCALPTTFGNGSLLIADPAGISNYALYVLTASVHYLYNHNEDSFFQIANAGFPNNIGFNGGGGNCGCFHPWSQTFTANGGTTTTVTVDAATFNICGTAIGSTIECRLGNNITLRRTITEVYNNAGAGNVTLTFNSALPFVYANTDTFVLSTGTFWVFVPATGTPGLLRPFDVATLAWTTAANNTGLPNSFGTDGAITTVYQIGAIFATGTATSGGASTITNSGKTWTVNQWANYQIRITAGTGIGQTRIIASNTGTVITTASAWTTPPDATSVYSIEGDSDSIYLVGNNSVSLFKYSISTNTWSTVTPTASRSFQPVAGESLHWCAITGNSVWANESAILDGKYLYSMIGNVSSAIDQFDLAALSWVRINYTAGGSAVGEQFGTGTSAFIDNGTVYIVWPTSSGSNSIQKLLKYDIPTNTKTSMAIDPYLNSTIIIGSKCWVKRYDTPGVIKWLYWARQSGTYLQRIML